MGAHPVERVRTLVVTTDPNVAIAAPLSTVWNLSRGYVRRVDVVIPSGHVGLTGIAFQWGGRQVIPYEAGEWITGNDDEVTVELELYVHTSLTVVTYNLDDTFAHSHHLRAYVVDLERRDSGLFAPGVDLGEGIAFLEPSIPAADLGPFTEGEWIIVSTALDNFLAQLQGILDGFLLELDARIGLGETPAEELPAEGELPVEEPTTEPKTGNTVPDVRGMTREAATRKLKGEGFTVAVERRRERGKEVVVAQRPEPGRIRAAGFTVTIVVRVNP